MHLSSPCIESDYKSTTPKAFSPGFDHRCQKQAVPSADCIWGKQVRFLALETPPTSVQLNCIEMSLRWDPSNDCISLWILPQRGSCCSYISHQEAHSESQWDLGCSLCSCRQLPLCTSWSSRNGLNQSKMHLHKSKGWSTSWREKGILSSSSLVPL